MDNKPMAQKGNDLELLRLIAKDVAQNVIEYQKGEAMQTLEIVKEQETTRRKMIVPGTAVVGVCLVCISVLLGIGVLLPEHLAWFAGMAGTGALGYGVRRIKDE